MSCPQLASREIGRVDDGAGTVADGGQQLALARDGIFERGAILHQGVQAARFLIALDDDRCRRFNIIDRILQMHIVQLLQRLKQRVKRHARADIRHERDLFISSLRCQTQLSKLRDHLCRHIVDAVKAEVFQIGRGPALSWTYRK